MTSVSSTISARPTSSSPAAHRTIRGMFETNLHDERFLPFEGAGAISTWTLTLPNELRAFDYSTISDVILHVRYTAREAGGSLAADGDQGTEENLRRRDALASGADPQPEIRLPDRMGGFRQRRRQPVRSRRRSIRRSCPITCRA